MTDFFCRLNGSDTTGDGSTGTPWRTIDHSVAEIVALPNAGNGDRLLIGDGEWGVCDRLQLAERPDATDYLTIEAENRRLAKLGTAGSSNYMYCFDESINPGASNWNWYKWKGFVIRNFRSFEAIGPECNNHHLWWEDNEFVACGYVIFMMGDMTYMTVNGNYIHDNNGAVEFGQPLHILIEDNDIGPTMSLSNRLDGITLGRQPLLDNDCIIRGNRVHGMRGTGIDCGMSYAIIEDNVCWGNLEGGIKNWNQGMQIRRNVCVDNSSAQFLFSHAFSDDNTPLPDPHIVDHNTAISPTAGGADSAFRTAGGSANKIQMTNNIWVGSWNNTNTAGWKHADFVANHNLYYWVASPSENIYASSHGYDPTHTYSSPGDLLGVTDKIAEPLLGPTYCPEPDSPAIGMDSDGYNVGYMGPVRTFEYDLPAEMIRRGELNLETADIRVIAIKLDEYVPDPSHTSLADVPVAARLNTPVVMTGIVNEGEQYGWADFSLGTIAAGQYMVAQLIYIHGASDALSIPWLYVGAFWGMPLLTNDTAVNIHYPLGWALKQTG